KPGPLIAASRAPPDAFVYVERAVFPSVRVARAGKYGEIGHTRVAIDLPAMSKDSRYYFGAGGLANLVAYSPSESRCAIVHRLQIEICEVPPGLTIIGMVELRTGAHGHAVHQPFAVAIDGSGTGIELLRPGERRRILTTAAPITWAAASDAAPVIAFITQSGELGVYSCAANAMVLRVATETMA